MSEFVGYKGSTIKGELVVEDNTVFKGRFAGFCSIGTFSYCGEAADFDSVDVGRFCSIARGVTIGSTEHPTDRFTSHIMAFDGDGPFAKCEAFGNWKGGHERSPAVDRTTIGHDVWIGRGAIIRRGVTIGSGAVIGAGAVVTRSVSPYDIVAGVPAKRLRARFPSELIDRLICSQWWNYDLPAVLSEIDWSNVERTLAQVEEAVHSHTASLLLPKKFRINSLGITEIVDDSLIGSVAKPLG